MRKNKIQNSSFFNTLQNKCKVEFNQNTANRSNLRYFFLLICILISQLIWSQSADVELNTPLTSDTNVEATNSITLGAGFDTNGFIFMATIVAQPPQPIVTEYNLNENLNWITSASYNISGELLGSGITYFNDFGKPTQDHSLNIITGEIWVNETRYDILGRPALNTLSSPVGIAYGYKNNFITKSDGNVFTNSDFESGDILNPATIGSQVNTLGNYYSSANMNEVYQDITDRPYSRTIYSQLRPGQVKQIIGANKLDTDGNGTNDNWKQGYSFTMPSAQELYYAFGYNYFDNNPSILDIYTEVPTSISNDNSKKIIWLKSSKTIIEDIQGNESVVFKDSDGKILASARSGGNTQYIVTSLIGKQKYIDIHIPKDCENTLSFIGSLSNYRVYDLKTEQPYPTTPSTLPSGFYRIEYIGTNELSSISSMSYINAIDHSINPISSFSAGVNYNVNYYDYALNYYNETGQLIKTLQPLGFDSTALNNLSATNSHNHNLVTEFQYNSLGQLLYSKSPDEGEVRFKYRDDGQIRFSQNNRQESAGEFSYTNYDNLGRPIESGVCIGSFLSLNPTTEWFSGIRKEQRYTEYDYLSDTSELTQLGLSTEYQNPKFLSGNIVKTYNNNSSGNLISASYYSYDAYGRVEWMVQNIVGLGVKTINYEYDPVTSQVSKIIYQKNDSSELFIHRYTYNIAQELVKVETSEDGSSYTIHAEYKYYKTGELKRIELAEGIQGIDYTYNLNGQLKGINHPSLLASKDPGGDGNDLFGIVIDYYNNDYLRNSDFSMLTSADNQFNGNIKAITSNTKWSGAIQPTALYRYKYNNNNWLSEANFSGGNATSSTDYRVQIPEYDANGNIKRLIRNKHTENNSNVMDDFTYIYKNGNTSNKLDHINDTVTSATNSNDLKDQSPNNYIYNEIGQLVENTEESIKYEYNSSGLVTKVYKNNQLRVSFDYNEKNYRTQKHSYINGILDRTTYYVLDATGKPLAVYENSILKEHHIYGVSRLGFFDRSTSMSIYQLTDHLGNIRAVIAKDNNNVASLVNAVDYYPGGMPMPGRQILSESYRYGYQGEYAETDFETGKPAFQLRLYDPRINRWISPDPEQQYPSPYMSMGNNWMNGTDPDGALFIIDDFLFGFIGGLFQSKDKFSDPSKSRLGNAINNGSRMASNSSKIWASLFRTDSDKKLGGKILQIASKLTWELPQSLGGVLSGHIIGYVNGIEEISNYHGATIVRTKALKESGENARSNYWGFTVGSVITTSYTKYEGLRQHEFGHYLVSRFQGPLFIPANILSPVSSFINQFTPYGDFHEKMPWEKWADRKSRRFFKTDWIQIHKNL